MELVKLRSNPHDEILDKIVSSWTFNPTRERVHNRIEKHLEEDQLFVASDNGTIFGSFALHKIDDDLIEITGIGILKEYRMKGLGRDILNQFHELTFAAKIIVETDDEAVGFYMKSGFIIKSEKILENGIIRYELELKSI
ncbi:MULTISPECIES: GNAT family N-acetyltransferase [unclassified Oceanispirochaeta]|uniref:GNAT family N-acetyltransferase n=1 Tax=unclassified Oceanispirochaeta TaxID=2635722 RepID=UPI000E094620|nr:MULTISPECIES: GNAT family N-acetyltransferase [unclassified Oceanispirochaeta]MBF9017080.1 GNAT family N-acetyltransferase [Oceanispirochaeta sp. M2]NPD73529.1 GNAT family N-acetyltransferase [Oceanispirochaeta sp. M1]RDG30817.1 N-acetyltransferase [Oceanispirochaeta sp. M1]